MTTTETTAYYVQVRNTAYYDVLGEKRLCLLKADTRYALQREEATRLIVRATSLNGRRCLVIVDRRDAKNMPRVGEKVWFTNPALNDGIARRYYVTRMQFDHQHTHRMLYGITPANDDRVYWWARFEQLTLA